MKVRELLNVYEDHEYCDVVILDGDAEHCGQYGEDSVLADYDHKDYNDWYCGQLDYFSEINVNPLIKWLDYKVKSFTVINDAMHNGVQCMYITI